MSRLEKEKHNSYERSSKREKSSDSESSSCRDYYRRSSSRTDDDDGRSTPEEIGNGQYKRDYEKSKNASKERERQKRHEKSRHVSNSSTDKSNRKHREYRKDRERDRSRERRRSYSSSDESDSYYRRHKRRDSRSRSRSRDKKSREREPRRSTDSSCAQKSGDRRLFPLASDDKNSASAKPSNLPEKEAASWRDGGPLPPPVFIGNQSVAPPPPNISGNVPPQSKYLKEKRSSINNTEISKAVTPQESCRSSFVPPSYLTMPPHPNSIGNNPNTVPPPLALGGRPPVPPPIRPPPGAPPALGHRPPPPPIRPKMQNTLSISSNISSEAPQEKIVKYHEAPKAPKRIEIKPEIKLSPPKVQTSQTKNIAIKLGATAKSKPTALNAKLPAKVASVFGAEDSDSEEEMPHEAKMRMRNVGRETITSSGPNSFGKTRQGFTDTKKLYEKNMHKPLFDD